MTYAMYGTNPNAYLAQTPYARMTGLVTQVNPQQIPNAYSYLQPTFVDMNQYRTSGIPEYPSFIGGTAMMNPQIPIAQTGQYNQSTYYPQAQQNYGYQQQGYTQQQMYPQQQGFPPQGQFYQEQTTMVFGQMPQYQSAVDIKGTVQSMVSNLVGGLGSMIIG